MFDYFSFTSLFAHVSAGYTKDKISWSQTTTEELAKSITPVNTPKPEFLGPVLKNGLVDLEQAKVYLLDGTNLGRLVELKEFNNDMIKD